MLSFAVPCVPDFKYISRYSSPKLYFANNHAQEQSRGIINLDEDDPEAIAEMLKYLYTLSDKLEVRRGTVLHPLGESELLHNVNHLAGVIVTAEKYGISTLAALAGEKLDWQLSDIEIPRAAKEAKKQICDLSDALYSRDPTPRLRWYQKRLTRMLLVRIFEPITKVPGLKEVIDMHPQFGWDLLESTCEELEYQRQMNRNMREKKDLTMQP